MERDDTNREAENAPDRERNPADPPEPRGNPEPERESVDKGEEQLDKVSGN
jgi:hypothetical protein